jgi:SAM-dependent methyltransferase
MTATADVDVKSLNDIPGWFPWIDQVVFTHFLSPGSLVSQGNLVELGVYLGKSAALMGRFVGAGETFTVCDLFGLEPDSDANRRENAKSYPKLTRPAFERNYLALFDELPTIVQNYSSAIVDHVEAASVRFLHVDASHHHEHVVVDIDSAAKLLRPDGVVVFDDYRSDHTPGVSAAVWEAVFTKGLQPICLTQQKLYATFGDRGRHQELLREWLLGSPKLWWEVQRIADRPVFRVAPAPKPKASAAAAAPGPRVDQLALRIDTLEERVGGLESRRNAAWAARAVRHGLARTPAGLRLAGPFRRPIDR